MPLTPEQQTLLDAVHDRLEADPEIEAAWLGGSLGAGGGDAFSDVDVVALVALGSPGAAGQRYAGDIDSIAEPALVNVLFGGYVVNVVTTDWARFDINFVGPSDLNRFDAARLMLLFNRGDRAPPTVTPTPYSTTPETVLPLVNEFLRVLGLLTVAVGREEWVLSLAGADILRRLTIDLMLEDNGVGPAERGGALHRNPLLTAEQRRALESVSPMGADRDSVITGNAQLAAIFLPRARRLADRIGMAWPSVLEDATRRHLHEQLGLTI